MQIDEQELQAFVGRFVAGLGAVLHAGTVLIGDSLRPRPGGPAHGRLIDIG